MSTSLDATSKPDKPAAHTVQVTLNGEPVEVPAPKATGLEIKQAAIAAGLPVQLDFVLSQERPNGDTKIVGNEDEVVVNKTSKFVLVPADDNS